MYSRVGMVSSVNHIYWHDMYTYIPACHLHDFSHDLHIFSTALELNRTTHIILVIEALVPGQVRECGGC